EEPAGGRVFFGGTTDTPRSSGRRPKEGRLPWLVCSRASTPSSCTGNRKDCHPPDRGAICTHNQSMNSPPPSAPSDEQLAVCLTPPRKSSAARDAEAAFQQLYQRHARPLLAFLAGRVRRDLLDDVHQTVWLRVWERTPERIEGGNFRAWLFQVARN